MYLHAPENPINFTLATEKFGGECKSTMEEM